MSRNTVQLGVMGSQRVLVDSQGLVYVPREGWVSGVEAQRVPGETYERPWDVPSAWCGAVTTFPPLIPGVTR